MISSLGIQWRHNFNYDFKEVIMMMVLTLVGMAFIPFLALVGVSAC
ncbi:hypothetical protein FM106_16685 [Brachybacterium faecium]|nr:hypothetical protein FM106_16685 [Brachybacterium faecium]